MSADGSTLITGRLDNGIDAWRMPTIADGPHTSETSVHERQASSVGNRHRERCAKTSPLSGDEMPPRSD
jgi:hypothetical protein